MSAINYIPSVPLLNGVAYSWVSVQVWILGKPVTGIKSIKYKVKQNKENNYGSGAFVNNRGFGKIEPTASIELFYEEIVALRKLALTPGGLMDIPAFDIIITYMPAPAKFVTDIIRNCEFIDDGNEIKEGDMNDVVSLELICSHLSLGTTVI